MTTRYRIPAFIKDAKRIMAQDRSLADRQGEISERLSTLSRNDELMRGGLPLGPADASTQNYLLWREAPYVFLGMAQFDEHYVSPVHEHDHYWVVGCGFRGRDRWDMYIRHDDQSDPGYAELEMVDQYDIPPGKTAIMPPPPRSIHAHNNLHSGTTLELIFSMAEPTDPMRRIIYDVEEKAARLSQWKPNELYKGGDYPGPVLGNRLTAAKRQVAARFRDLLCPVCRLARVARAWPQPSGSAC